MTLTSDSSFKFIRVNGASRHPLPSKGVHLLNDESTEWQPSGVLGLVPVELDVVCVHVRHLERAFRLAGFVCGR